MTEEVFHAPLKRNYKSEFLQGMKMGIPIVVGFIPVAIAFAIMAKEAGMSGLQAVLMSAMVFAGASQIMATGMIAAGASTISMIVATFILNLRHLIMSTCVVNQMEKSNIGLKLLACFGITDETFAVFTSNSKNFSIWYFFGLALMAYSSWVIGTVLGIVASDILPKIISDSFGIALYALFIALLVPNVKRSLRLGIIVVLTGGLNWLLLNWLPSGWALIVATLLGAWIGIWVVED